MRAFGSVVLGLLALFTAMLVTFLGVYPAAGFTGWDVGKSCLDHAPRDWYEAVRIQEAELMWVPPSLRCRYENTLTGETASWSAGDAAVPYVPWALASFVLGITAVARGGLRLVRTRGRELW